MQQASSTWKRRLSDDACCTLQSAPYIMTHHAANAACCRGMKKITNAAN
jgi:hypothetical protein